MTDKPSPAAGIPATPNVSRPSRKTPFGVVVSTRPQWPAAVPLSRDLVEAGKDPIVRHGDDLIVRHDLRIRAARKERPCLACQKPFASEWPGERICHSCKKSSAWRSGVVGSSNGRQK